MTERSGITAPRRHEPWIDWLRAAASLAVVVFHLNEVRGAHDWYAAIVSYGWLGVSVFFVVSGYCVMLASLDRPPALDFLIRRYVRVLPPYWASIVVVIAVVVLRKLVTGTNDVVALPTGAFGLLATATLTTLPVSSVPTLNWVYWTLSYELAFYGIMALALISRRVFPWAMFAVTLTSLMLPAYPLNKLPGLFFIDHWPLFALGVGLAETVHRRTTFGYALLVIAGVAVVATERVSSSIAGLATAVTIVVALYLPGADQRLRSRTALFLGTISYSLYLIHVPIGVYLLGHVVGIGPTDSIAQKVMLDLLLVAGCILFAYGFNRVVERPAQKFARTLRRRERRGPPVSAVVGAEP